MKLNNITIILVLIMLSYSCVQETHQKTITFKVNMKSLATVNNVGIRGNFTENAWEDTIPLLDKNDDSIFEATISQKTAVNQIQFKFVNQGVDYELKGSKNRIIEFEYKPEHLVYETTFDKPEADISRIVVNEN